MTRRNKIILLNLFWFIVIAILSYRMPLYNDDYLHSTSFVSGDDITGIGMILPSVKEYYNIWGGRALSMFFIQLMLYLPRWVYALCNGGIYIAVIYAAYRYLTVNGSKEAVSEYGYEIVSLLSLGMWFFMPDFAEVVIWPTGSVTYLWMHLFILLFGFIYYRDYFTSEADEAGDTPGLPVRIALAVLTVILGFCAGLSAEASACTLGFALFLYVLGRIRDHRRIQPDKWLGIISFLLGFAMLMLAPGNRVRTSVTKEEAEAGVGFFTLMFHRVGRETFYLLLFLTVPASISLMLYVMSKKDRIGVKTVLGDICSGYAPFFMMLSVISVYVMTFPSGFANRIYQFPLIMLLIAMGQALVSILNTAAVSPDWRKTIIKGIRLFIVIMLIAVVAEIVAGSLFAAQSGTFFDRQMLYYHYDDLSVDGLLPGNGINSN